MAPVPVMEMTREEFETLPSTVRRKCFSTSERLQYARAQRPVDEPHHSANHSLLARDLLRRPTRPAAGRAKPTHSFSLRPTGSRGARVTSTLTDADLTPEFARFYDRLPDKIKRGQFSAQERNLLHCRPDRPVLDAAPDHHHQLSRRSADRSLPSLRSDSSGYVSLSDTDDLTSLQTEADMDQELLSTFRWIDESEPDLTLDDYHRYVARSAEPKAKPEAPAPFRRSRSYTNFSIRNVARRSTDQRSGTADGPKARKAAEQWSSRFPSSIPPVPTLPDGKSPSAPAAAPPTPPSAPPEPRVSASHPRGKLEQWGPGWGPTSPHMHQRQESISAPAQHYLTPEARLKLRLYLATPSNFDEALEHGFPTLPSSQAPSRPSMSSRTHSHGSRARHVPPGLTFLRDETSPDLSVAEDSKDYGPVITAISRPGSSYYEPTEASPPSSPRSVPRSADRTTAASRDYSYEAEPYHGGWESREMTLRMTLTRPDLRADESVLYPQYPTPHAGGRSRFIGGGKKAPQPNDGPIGTVSIVRNPLSLEDLFADQAPPKAERTGLRKLFSKKW